MSEAQSPTIIPPTVGRVVWIRHADHPESEQPEAGVVAYVHSDRCINVAGFDHNGQPFSKTSVTLVQQDDPTPTAGIYAEWMPYQLGQAKKHAAPQERDTADFAVALRMLKQGKRVARQGWNGKDTWLALSPGTPSLPAEKFWAGPNRAFAEQNGGAAEVLPSITMKTADDKIVMGWLASQTDLLADDWFILD